MNAWIDGQMAGSTDRYLDRSVILIKTFKRVSVTDEWPVIAALKCISQHIYC